jgi:hypothetical protein
MRNDDSWIEKGKSQQRDHVIWDVQFELPFEIYSKGSPTGASTLFGL